VGKFSSNGRVPIALKILGHAALEVVDEFWRGRFDFLDAPVATSVHTHTHPAL
jgi:hypothetical protein